MPHSPYLIPLENIAFGELDFSITVAEQVRHIPFGIKRAYWLRAGAVPVQRGNHSHVNSRQLLVSLAGEMHIEVTDTALQTRRFVLADDRTGLYIPERHWLRIDMPAGGLLLCLSSALFSEQETIYDFNEFAEKA